MEIQQYVNKEEEQLFVPNRPSVIDLYFDEETTFEDIELKLQDQTLFKSLEIINLQMGIMKVKVLYKDNYFSIYIKIVNNDDIDLTKINRVLVDEEDIYKAAKTSKYIKTYVDAKTNFVQAYYAQIKLLYLLSNKPLIIVDCTQWCIYSAKYLQQFALNDIDIIDSNLYKVKATPDNTIYTEGLERFGIKDIEMCGIDTKYIKSCASFLSQLSRYFIKNGQIANSWKIYNEVFEQDFYACIVDIEEAIITLDETAIINMEKRDQYLNENKLYITVHTEVDIEQWYLNDENVLKYLDENTTFYTDSDHFEDEKNLAQATIVNAINFLNDIEDQHNLMILARNQEINTDWYYFDSIEDGIFNLKTDSETLQVNLDDIMNWNYRGLTPLHAYSISE
ncbi:DUF4026 domain-containing protein [Mycoplasma sp. P36-A1]|uniref:DUF4026 domain-containing protein n=1 Tax=Mycoplasma sp. P36-A1 TaxID=3252900 RepID=UPI003C2F7FCF